MNQKLILTILILIIVILAFGNIFQKIDSNRKDNEFESQLERNIELGKLLQVKEDAETKRIYENHRLKLRLEELNKLNANRATEVIRLKSQLKYHVQKVSTLDSASASDSASREISRYFDEFVK